MSLHDDLLARARQLSVKEPERPLQASLRRSVSASYYALSRLGVDDPDHRSQFGQVEAALHALGQRLVIATQAG